MASSRPKEMAVKSKKMFKKITKNFEAFTMPVPLVGDIGMVTFSIRNDNRIRIVHETDDVDAMVRRVVGEIWPDNGLKVDGKYGVLQFELPVSPFGKNVDRESDKAGKMFLKTILQEMHLLGYDFMFTSDLARFDNSSWFFKKSSQNSPRKRKNFVFIAPKGHDKLDVYHWGRHELVDEIRELCQGAQGEVSESDFSEIHLGGSPWSKALTDRSKLLILDVVVLLSRFGWELMTATNVNSGPSTLIFTSDGDLLPESDDFAMVTFGDKKFLKMFRFDSTTKNNIKAVLDDFFDPEEVVERVFDGNDEFLLPNSPFFTSPSSSEAKQARFLTCKVLEQLRRDGWDCVHNFELIRHSTVDKTNLIFRKVPKKTDMKVISLFPSESSKLTVVGATNDLRDYIHSLISEHYKPGAKLSTYGSLILEGDPWTKASGYGLHALSMLMFVLNEVEAHLGMRPIISCDVASKHYRPDDHFTHGFALDVHSLFFECKDSSS